MTFNNQIVFWFVLSDLQKWKEQNIGKDMCNMGGASQKYKTGIPWIM